ncbi:PIG-L deacetylase family protein [Rhodococcus erythropolis]|uniref:PIG-L deacetylase family protein n=1 Tax=Rhodococcus erythropolis TaxID=1833 RepID=UPI003A4DCDD8
MVNSKLFAQKPVDDGGTPESIWQEWGRSFPELDLTGCSRLIVVAPHPDDEILGLGGTALLATLSGIDVHVVSVTDGGASHPDSPTVTQPEMEHLRRSESDRAARVLGIPAPVRLSLPDGKIRENRQELTDRLSSILGDSSTGTWCASTWRGDGHPDHEATGEAAAKACADTGSRLIEYPIWAWHWAEPDHAAVPWERTRRVALPSDVQAAKSAAANEFTSQIAPLSDHPADAPILPRHAMERLLRPYETVFV